MYPNELVDVNIALFVEDALQGLRNVLLGKERHVLAMRTGIDDYMAHCGAECDAGSKPTRHVRVVRLLDRSFVRV